LDGVIGWLGDIMIVGGFTLDVGIAVLAYRAGALRLRRSSGLAGLEPQERHRARRQIRGQASAEAHELPVLRAIAQELLNAQWAIGLSGGLILVLVGRALQHRTLSHTILSVLPIVLLTVGMILLYSDVRRARRFLRLHSA
jgi:hypothetical protein